MSESNIGSGIKTNGPMHFGGTVPKHFDEHVKQSVPGYERVMGKIGFISQFFLHYKGSILDLGSGTGRCIDEIVKMNKGKQLHITAIDNSPEMAQYIRDKWKDSNNWIHELNVYSIDLTEFNFRESSYDLIVAGLVFQFVPEEKRDELIKNIHRSLKPNGAFIWYEKCSEESPYATEIAKQYMNHFKLQAGLTADEIQKKDEVLRGILKGLSFQKNQDHIFHSAFREVTIVDKDFNFTLFVCIK